MVVSEQASVIDRTLALEVTGHWQGASGQLTYGDIGDIEKLEKDQTLTLRPIMTDRTRLVKTSTLLETTGR